PAAPETQAEDMQADDELQMDISDQAGTNAQPLVQSQLTSQDSATNTQSALSAFAKGDEAVKARKAMARYFHNFIQNTRSGTLGLTGSVLLIFAAISLLSRIEVTFNDIWGVARGRGWFTRIVLYWGVLSLLPLIL